MDIKAKILVSALFISLGFSINSVSAQDLLIHEKNLGFNVGLNLAVGTHFQRLGVNLNFYYSEANFQANSEIRLYYNFRSLGPRLRSPEVVLSEGLLFAYGAKSIAINPFLNSLSNQTAYQNAIGYVYNAYFNPIKTTQQTGAISFQFDKITFIAENDLLAKPALDRFRTGAFLLQYQYENIFQAAINCSLWTGKMGYKAGIINPKFNYQCYMDTTKSVYANTSHGLLSAQFKYALPYSQNVQANIGVDAEQVRNAVQNHLIHDLRFIPKKYNKAKNCHIPMLDTEGNQYLYKEGQVVRSPKLFFNLFTNANIFY